MIKIIKEDIKKIIKLPNLNFFNQKKILIFGASGIVGQYFLIFFLELLNKKHAPLQITLIFKNKIPDYLKFLRKNKRIKINANCLNKIYCAKMITLFCFILLISISAYFVGCKGIKGAPKHAEKDGSGSITPASVPATLLVYPEIK